jgi:hypothetical protein
MSVVQDTGAAKHTNKWIVCFTPHVNRGTWRLFTFWRPQYQHVFATRYDARLGSWIYAECSSLRFHFELKRDDDATKLVHYMIYDCECIQIEVEPEPVYLPRFLYCVSFIKHLIGIRGYSLLTPYQLRCELLKRGGEVIFDKSTMENNDGIFKKAS